MKSDLERELERQRDAHRNALNQIADLLGVVHEDDKIIEAVRARLSSGINEPMSPSDGLRVRMLAPRSKAEAAALTFALKFFVEECTSDWEKRERVDIIESMLHRAGVRI